MVMGFYLNPDNDGFWNAVRSEIYVDKTGLLYELSVKTGNKVTLFPRPRRFGKTLTMSMIESFFDNQWNSKDVEGLTFDEAYAMFEGEIAGLCIKYRFLETEKNAAPADQAVFHRLMFKESSKEEIKNALKTIMRMMYTVYGKEVILLVDEYDVLTYAEHRIHIVGIDYCGDIILMCDVAQQLVNQYRGTGVESRVRLVAEEIFRIERNGTRYGHALLHTAGYLRRIFVFGTFEIDSLDAEHGTVVHFASAHIGEHAEWKHDIAQHRLGVEECGALKKHAYFLAQLLHLLVLHAEQIAAVEENFAAVGTKQTYERFHEHCLARTALAYD